MGLGAGRRLDLTSVNPGSEFLSSPGPIETFMTFPFFTLTASSLPALSLVKLMILGPLIPGNFMMKPVGWTA